jgi:hypothetical protein
MHVVPRYVCYLQNASVVSATEEEFNEYSAAGLVKKIFVTPAAPEVRAHPLEDAAGVETPAVENPAALAPAAETRAVENPAQGSSTEERGGSTSGDDDIPQYVVPPAQPVGGAGGAGTSSKRRRTNTTPPPHSHAC